MTRYVRVPAAQGRGLWRSVCCGSSVWLCFCNREALCKKVYQHLFDWMCSKCNEKCDASESDWIGMRAACSDWEGARALVGWRGVSAAAVIG